MSEQPREGADAAWDEVDDQIGVPPDDATVPRTGVATLDAALDDLDGLADRDVTEHLEVFERVHEKMRSVLDGREQ